MPLDACAKLVARTGGGRVKSGSGARPLLVGRLFCRNRPRFDRRSLGSDRRCGFTPWCRAGLPRSSHRGWCGSPGHWTFGARCRRGFEGGWRLCGARHRCAVLRRANCGWIGRGGHGRWFLRRCYQREIAGPSDQRRGEAVTAGTGGGRVRGARQQAQQRGVQQGGAQKSRRQCALLPRHPPDPPRSYGV